MANKWTESQLIAINDREHNLLVSASAGSGKTTVMIERLVSLLREGHSLKNIIVSTFTKSASADMKNKLAVALEKLVAECGESRFKEELDYLPISNISTFDSLCQRIIKKYFHVVDVDPNFKIIDEIEASKLLNEAIDFTMQKFISANDSDFSLLYEVMLRSRNDNKLRGFIKKMYTFCASLPSIEWLDSCLWSYEDMSMCTQIINDSQNEQKQEYFAALEHMNICAMQLNMPYLCNYIAEVKAKLIDSAVELSRLSCPRNLDGGQIALKEQFTKLRDGVKKFVENIRVPLADNRLAQPLAAVLVDMCKCTADRFGQLKKRKAALDYSDLERYALEILTSSVGEEIRSSTHYLFVDEYQDINGLQESILKLLVGQKLFVVGDVKQSIYGFRMCDPSIFTGKYREFRTSDGCKAIELNHNFRSRPEILDFVNLVFSRIMTEKFGSVDYKNTAQLISGRGAADSDAVQFAPLEFHLIETKSQSSDKADYAFYSVENDFSDSGKAISKAVEAETSLIVQHILKLLAGEIVEKGKTRAVKCSDIVVLLRTKGNFMKVLADKLNRADVPSSFCSEISLLELGEVSVLIDFLKVLDNETDEIALASLLVSADFSYDEIAEIGSYERDSFYNKFCNRARGGDELGSKLRELRREIGYYRNKLFVSSISDVLSEFVTKRNFFLQMLAHREGTAKAENVSNFLTMVASSPYNYNLSGLLEYLGGGKAKSEVLSSDCVKIMTIHNSKGLEFPFVIMADCNRLFNKSDQRTEVLLDKDIGVALKYFDTVSHEARHTYATKAAEIVSARQQTEEQMRVLYVAMTRAVTQLAVFVAVDDVVEHYEPVMPPNAKCLADWLLQSIIERGYTLHNIDDCAIELDGINRKILFSKSNREVVDMIRQFTEFRYGYASMPSKVTATATARNLAESESQDVAVEKLPFVREIERELLSAQFGDEVQLYAIEQLETKEQSQTKEQLEAREQAQAQLQAQTSEKGRKASVSAIDIGNAYHKAMEIVDFHAPLEGQLAELSTINNFSTISMEQLERAYNAIRRLSEGKSIYREKEFILNISGSQLGYDSEDPVLCQGKIDLLILSGDSAIIVDFKTTRDGIIREEYRAQMRIYKLAVEKILTMRTVETYLFNFNSGELVPV